MLRRYGPWEAASAAVLYPSPFDETTYGNWPSRHTPGSTNSMDHFIAYVKGATGSVKTGMKTDDSLGADLTGPWHLFVDDDELLNRSSSVVRKYSQMDKFGSNPVLEGALYGTVLRTTEGGYAMWHECGTSVCYANSSDGKTWSQPKGLDEQLQLGEVRVDRHPLPV